jgi:hypothetical protein
MPSDVSRRMFLKTLGGAAAATVVSPTELFGGTVSGRTSLPFAPVQKAGPRKRIAVIWEDGLRQLSGSGVSREVLDKALQEWDVTILAPDQVGSALSKRAYDLLLDPLGPYFPVEGWHAIETFLLEGGRWVHCGGAPFAVPAVRSAENPHAWRAEARTTAFHRKLGITQAFAVAVSEAGALLSNTDFGDLAQWRGDRPALTVEELSLRLAVKSDVPGEEESEGIRQAEVHPLILVRDAAGKPLAAPVIEIDRIAGSSAGGRWVLANFVGAPSAPLLTWMVRRALVPVMRCTVVPSVACYHAGEKPSFDITIGLPGKDGPLSLHAECRIEIEDRHGTVVAQLPVHLAEEGATLRGHIEPPPSFSTPGLYRVRATGFVHGPGVEGVEIVSENGFWMLDEALLRSGPRYAATRDYFTKDGTVFPVTGTTYMASDAHRHFLLAPNPAGWDDDFRAMKRSGVNMVRTGLWGGWKSIAPKGKDVREPVLRAFEAYVLTARTYDIPVIFTFFAFLPQAWGGENPYFDPVAIAAQSGFVEGFAVRFANVRGLLWDLINEPSFSSAANLWKCRPNYDRHELEAWRNWVGSQTVVDQPEGRRVPLADIWRARNIDPDTLPSLDDFTDVNIIGDLVPAKAEAYRRFAQEKFAGWAATIRDVIATKGSKTQLVTVGQDEGGSYERPSPVFFADAVDFTCDHTWWLNDDLLWDGLTSKTPSKPNLIEETGIMFYERADGLPWRTEEETRNLLERKMALAFAGAGAGFIQWLWNTNVLMPSDNEVAIGFLRADGTAKPELEAFERIAALIRNHEGFFADRRPEEVVMVIPTSNLFAVRSVALDATKRCVRTMEYVCDSQLRTAGEYQLRAGLQGARCILVPSAGMLREESWQELLSAARRGATVLITGHLERDETSRVFPRFSELGLAVDIAPVSSGEECSIDGKPYRVTFREDKMQKIEKGVVRGSGTPWVHVVPVGEGKILWMPLPLEAADDVLPVEALYRYALREAGIIPLYSREQGDPSVLIRPIVFPRATMYVLVNESSADRKVRFTPSGTGKVVEVDLPAGRATVEIV